jgi:hypothetical protein
VQRPPGACSCLHLTSASPDPSQAPHLDTHRTHTIRKMQAVATRSTLRAPTKVAAARGRTRVTTQAVAPYLAVSTSQLRQQQDPGCAAASTRARGRTPKPSWRDEWVGWCAGGHVPGQAGAAAHRTHGMRSGRAPPPASARGPKSLALQVAGSTAVMLAVGRFAFLPMHRRDLERSVAVSGPKTTGGCLSRRDVGRASQLHSGRPCEPAARPLCQSTHKATAPHLTRSSLPWPHPTNQNQAPPTLTACSRRPAL